ncbi:Lrp/AsnC family transcriptional regulator [Antarctobacter heliothermus]|uniref:DNA-binding transcriptional regulator, Lrp family n=1 Tax=Antarctobacter heliothermus TaxID=74033 RepID=A0A239B6K0_9RHOB|nr:Lrp/AsnC family transcriptional regulator [Antarctobacter heliothermus]SNS03409.1 DNA-binding transcriptional regulator, Lrp family [Antarctobacter heliothermus]
MQEKRADLDTIDIALLDAVQRDGQATAQDLSAALNLSASQAGRRRQRLEEAGVIRGYRARLDPEKLGLDVQAFVQVQLARHGAKEGTDFARLLRVRPEIISAWTMTGEADYLLRIYCPDLSALNMLIHDVLLAHPVVARVHSQIVMDQPKADAPLPVG